MNPGDKSLFGVTVETIPAACGEVAGCGKVQIVVDAENLWENIAIPAGARVWLVWTEKGWQIASAEVQ